uniref:Uncharacterized protein n=1 Tax=Cucumis melo TaxID=3656 RepID=A0A9I9D3R1_CUCME
MFLNMLKSFKSKHDYIKWYSEQSKVKMCLSEDANRPQEEKMDKHKVKPKKESSVLDSKNRALIIGGLSRNKGFKSKHDYIKWYTEQSKLKTRLSEDANRPQEEKINKHKVKPKKESSVLDSKKQSTQHQWIIKHPKVVRTELGV